jgi:hypothetical protein
MEVLLSEFTRARMAQRNRQVEVMEPGPDGRDWCIIPSSTLTAVQCFYGSDGDFDVNLNHYLSHHTSRAMK